VHSVRVDGTGLRLRDVISDEVRGEAWRFRRDQGGDSPAIAVLMAGTEERLRAATPWWGVDATPPWVGADLPLTSRSQTFRDKRPRRATGRRT
jgi:hypothetical protein